MRALTIWQPWASLIIAGAKPYEFRSWRPPGWLIAQTLVIHAAARPVRRDEVTGLIAQLQSKEPWRPCLHRHLAMPILERALSRTAEPLPLGAGLGTATVMSPKDGWQCAEEFGGCPTREDREAATNWGWPLVNVRPFTEPQARSGAQGLWEW